MYFVDEIADRALSYRQIFIWDDIEDETAYDVVQQLSYLAGVSNQDIVICVHSHGGELEPMAAIIDEMIAIKSTGVRISTIAMGMAHSAAAVIISMGTKGFRFARPNSSIMLHPFSIALPPDYDGNQRALMTSLVKRTEAVLKLTAKACGKYKSYKKFLNDIDKGLWLTAPEAVDYGVVDAIWTKPLPIGGINHEENSNK